MQVKNLSSNIIILGLISFFTDVSSEMVYPLIPLFLSSTMGATPFVIGVIEGIAESLASLLKVYSGYLSDRFRRKKLLAFWGYSTGIVYKIILLLASSWVGVLMARIVDRTGKGIRTTPRDVLIYESADQNKRGAAFGLHKALDMTGSALGILLAYLILSYAGMNSSSFPLVFWISIIPAVIGLMLFTKVRETRRVVAKSHVQREPFWKNIGKIDKNLKLYLLVTALFTLGNSSNAFLLLKAKSVGFDSATVILLYFIYNICAAVLSVPMGKASDTMGRKGFLVLGYLLFSLVYLGFGFAAHKSVLIASFMLYGVYTAIITGAERAFIAEIAPGELKGTMLGLQATIVGVMLLPASLLAGFLWNVFGNIVPFFVGSALSLVSAIILMAGLRSSGHECPSTSRAPSNYT